MANLSNKVATMQQLSQSIAEDMGKMYVIDQRTVMRVEVGENKLWAYRYIRYYITNGDVIDGILGEEKVADAFGKAMQIKALSNEMVTFIEDLKVRYIEHVENTSEIGEFAIISHDFENGRWRVRFKLVD